MTDFSEIKGLVEKVNEALVPLRSEVDQIKASQRDVVTEAKFDKMANQVTSALEKLQAIEQKQAALEAASLRQDHGGAPKGDSVEVKNKLNGFLREKQQGTIEIKAMATDVGANGGFLVMPEFSSTVVTRVFETSPIRLVANIEQTGSKSRTFLIDDDEGSAEWVGERGTATEDSPQLGQKEIFAHDIAARIHATQDMLDDSYIDLSAWIASKASDKIARTENSAFFSGNGVAKPRGLLTYSAWAAAGTYERDKIEQIASGAATTVTADGFIDTQNSLKEAYQANAVWLMKRATFGATIKLKGSDQFYFGPMMLSNGVPSMQVLGKRAIFCDDMQATGTGSNLAVAYGDFRLGYTVLDRIGLQILRDPFSVQPYTKFVFTKRTGGDVTNFDAIKLMKMST